MEWFESRGQFMDGSYVPTSGDLIFFDWGNDGNIDHVGIVESVVAVSYTHLDVYKRQLLQCLPHSVYPSVLPVGQE